MDWKAFLWVSALLSAKIVLSHENLKNEVYQVFGGIHFQRESSFVPYEATLPMLFTTTFISNVTLTNFTYLKESCSKNTIYQSQYCTFLDKLESLSALLDEQLENQGFVISHSKIVSQKPKRALNFLGNFFHWCCGVATENQVAGVFDNQKNIADHANDIIKGVNEDHRHLITDNVKLNLFSEDVSEFSNRVRSEVNLLKQDVLALSNTVIDKKILLVTETTWTYLWLSLFQTNVKTIVQNCEQNLLSQTLVPKTVLETNLRKLEKSLLKTNLSLAIPIENVLLYYKLKIVTCVIQNGEMLLKMNVPIRNSIYRYTVYKPIKTPVVWENKLCNLKINSLLVIKSNELIKTIPQDYSECGVHSFPLCLIPREIMVDFSEHVCLFSVLQHEQISKLSNCSFECTDRPEFPIFTKLLPNKYLITNIRKNLTLQCLDKVVKVLEPTQIGTIRLNVPCNCSILLGNEILLNTVKPCDASDVITIKIDNLIPAHWSKIQSTVLFPLDTGLAPEYSHLHEFLDVNWTLKTPTFEVPKARNLSNITLQNKATDIFETNDILIYGLILWCAILTLCVLLLSLCLYIQSIKVKYMVPPRDFRPHLEL